MKSLAIPVVITTVSALNVIKEKSHETVDEVCKSTRDCPANKHCTKLLGHEYCADNTDANQKNGGGGGCSIMWLNAECEIMFLTLLDKIYF